MPRLASIAPRGRACSQAGRQAGSQAPAASLYVSDDWIISMPIGHIVVMPMKIKPIAELSEYTGLPGKAHTASHEGPHPSLGDAVPELCWMATLHGAGGGKSRVVVDAGSESSESPAWLQACTWKLQADPGGRLVTLQEGVAPTYTQLGSAVSRVASTLRMCT